MGLTSNWNLPGKPRRPEFLGTFPVDIENSPFRGYGKKDWALYFIQRWGGFEKEHQKAWVLDQVARILNGTPIIVEEKRWADGTNQFQVTLGEPTSRYHRWVAETCEGSEGPNTYDYDEGIAP